MTQEKSTLKFYSLVVPVDLGAPLVGEGGCRRWSFEEMKENENVAKTKKEGLLSCRKERIECGRPLVTLFYGPKWCIFGGVEWWVVALLGQDVHQTLASFYNSRICPHASWYGGCDRDQPTNCFIIRAMDEAGDNECRRRRTTSPPGGAGGEWHRRPVESVPTTFFPRAIEDVV